MDDVDSSQSITKDPAKKIKAINRDTVHKICSGQVVLNLAIAVKELVENSLDAGATTVEVRLKEYGQELIEVVDNGSGVEEENFSGLTLKYHTSKLSEFSDLLGVSTFGFRGEALSSLCSLSDLTITTRHSSTDLGTKIIYDYKGHIKDISPCARQVGTTVTLSNLFNTLPVRQKEFHRNIKREFNKMTQLLYAYCLVSEGKKIVCTNQTSKGNKTVVVATQGGSLRDNVACVFGVRQLQTLMDLKPNYGEGFVNNIKEKFFSDLEKMSIGLSSQEQFDTDIKLDHELELSEESSNDASNPLDKKINLNEEFALSQTTISSRSDSSISNDRNKHPFDFNGYISSCAHGSGRSTTERQFFYVNSRPCEPQKIMKVVNEVYKQFNPHQYPFVVMNLHVKRSSVDVNVTPDKRKIFLDREKSLLDLVKLSLNKLFENIPSTLKMENTSSTNLSQKSCGMKNIEIDAPPRVFSSFLSQFSNKSYQCDDKEKSKQNNKVDNKRKAQTMDNYISVKVSKKESEPSIIKENTDSSSDSFHSVIDESATKYEEIEKNVDNNIQKEVPKILNENIQDAKETVFLNYSENFAASQIVDVNEFLENNKIDTNEFKPKRCKQEDNSKLKVENKIQNNITIDSNINSKPMDRKICHVNITIDNIKSFALDDIKNRENKNNEIERVKFRSEINPVLNKKCEEELQKEISKEMFCKMKIIGQFNLGFIITQFEEDLFIVDQHATDEKHNYETLQKTTILSSQRLVVPQKLELTGVNERVLMDNLEICQKNGFTFDIDENAPPTKRVKLLTIPISKNYVFGKEDVDELLFMLKDAPNEICRPSRVQTMFASRACRKSVMIGTALSKSTMRKLIDNMSLLDQPWNCPHGRPTIRHLVNMALVESKKSSN